ncbi:TetR/AcrR family transcriptional regulator [Maledivibacter halophilus]|uniref:Transcriptional regulator, TetR family n=1 Tax=Maledivibacter halophilus TaxID=36842 RepID=A0A1T5MP02_9FIRM|nr:TetR/AcrR family transcriptional regulator [Maledivibacter halophilus]SKC89922.1 transcriptional regulator, TetR family [Maledivibacter halophilus]
MPKIIEDIEEHILNSAFELFGKYGYKKTDMKMIAKKAGIAVGTLYNYYFNKKQLFIEVFEKSWNYTFKRLNSIIKEDIETKEKIKKLIEALYDEISKRNGLGGELIRENVINEKNSRSILIVKEELLEKIKGLLKEMRSFEGIKLKEEMDERLISSLFAIIVEMTRAYPDENDKNLEFINFFLESIYRK